ncbi:hypothetical protein F5Y19DRAFT_485329 [Xylariaceae sp. FL1651]|nr:hypothetical protein F5Y19DRAFT_485329 [Xylariaceae sp. FL1651]
MNNEQNTTQTEPKGGFIRSFKPVKYNPAEAERFVRSIFKQKPNNLDLVATEFTPLFGFGPGSNYDVLARLKAQAVFSCQELSDPLCEFAVVYLHGEWSLPVAKWPSTIALVKKHRNDAAWTSTQCPVPEDGSADQFYARFLIRMLQRLQHPAKTTHLLHWLRCAEDEEDTCWVFFHALMYLQLESMHFNKANAPFRDFANHYVNKLTGPGSFFDDVCSFIALRRRND